MSELRRIGLPRAADRVVGEAVCADCGAAVAIDSGEEPFAPAARYLRRVLDGDASTYCEECAQVREERADAEEDARQRAERQRQRIRAAKIPATFRVSFDDVDEKSDAVVEAARSWARSAWAGGLVLVGDVGVGKTFLAGAAAVERTWHGPVRWVSVAGLLAGLRAGYGTDEQAAAARALTPTIGLGLVLDDFDKARPSAAALETLYLAIDRWTSRELPLLLTMNWDLDRIRDDWPEEFAEAIASRLAGYCRIVRLRGSDRRVDG